MHSESIKVVLDTNIIISAAISTDGNPAKIFELLLEKKIINYTTKEIIEEIEEVIERPAFKDSINEDYKKFILDNFKSNSIIIKSKFDERAVLKDNKDDKFVNCALTVKAEIISGDKHLLDLKNYKGVNILNAKTFLERFEIRKWKNS